MDETTCVGAVSAGEGRESSLDDISLEIRADHGVPRELRRLEHGVRDLERGPVLVDLELQCATGLLEHCLVCRMHSVREQLEVDVDRTLGVLKHPPVEPLVRVVEP